MKTECTRRLWLVPLRKEAFGEELDFFASWYNKHRPHVWLDGRTPNEVYFNRPLASRCALCRTASARDKHLPIITLKRVA